MTKKKKPAIAEDAFLAILSLTAVNILTLFIYYYSCSFNLIIVASTSSIYFKIFFLLASFSSVLLPIYLLRYSVNLASSTIQLRVSSNFAFSILYSSSSFLMFFWVISKSLISSFIMSRSFSSILQFFLQRSICFFQSAKLFFSVLLFISQFLISYKILYLSSFRFSIFCNNALKVNYSSLIFYYFIQFFGLLLFQLHLF